jgi:hypothetical protein
VVQAPQCAGSLVRSTHTPEQLVWPAGHAQTPALHTMPPLQTMPQPPQLFGSVVSLTHAPPQLVKLEGQPADEHAPAVQLPVGPQLLPHAPQLL